MPKLVTTSKRFLEWAQSLPYVVIPAGLESDMQEAIAEAEAAEHSVQRTAGTPCKKHGIDFCAECFPTTSRR